MLPSVIRVLWGGTKTRFALTQKMGEPWVSRNFPDLRPRRLMQSACQMVPLIWADATADTEHGPEQIVPIQLKRLQRQIRQLPGTNLKPRSTAARRLVQAAFARTAATLTGEAIPPDLVGSLRADRCLRDLVLTWIELVLITTAHPNPRNLLSSLAVHSTLMLPPGDRLPANLRNRLGSVRRELNATFTETELHYQTESLKRHIQISSSQVLALPMAFADALQTSSRHDS